jgi:hypothetical protein
LVTSEPWPDDTVVKEEMERMHISDCEVIKAFIPYYSVDFEVRTKRGLRKQGETAINASFLHFPRELGQVIPLFRPTLLKQALIEVDKDEAILFPRSELDLGTFLLKIVDWSKENDERIKEVRNSMKKIYSTLRYTLFLPAPPGFSRAEKRYSTILSKLLGQKYGINLLLGIGFGQSIESIVIKSSKLFHSKVVVLKGERPLIFEVSEKGIEFLSGLDRIFEELPESLNYVRSII